MAARPTAGAFAESAPATVEWYTPPAFFEGLGRFYVDVASPGREVTPWIPADHFVTKEDDGLHLGWWEGTCWNNPPYGRETAAWVERNVQHKDSLMLVFNRSDNSWFHRALAGCSAFKLLRGRIPFVNGAGIPGDKPAAGSVLFAFGEKNIPRLYSHTGPHSAGTVCFPGGFT